MLLHTILRCVSGHLFSIKADVLHQHACGHLKVLALAAIYYTTSQPKVGWKIYGQQYS